MGENTEKIRQFTFFFFFFFLKMLVKLKAGHPKINHNAYKKPYKLIIS